MRYSKQRENILNIVRQSNVHPTAEMVYNVAKETLPGIGIATVYRNLNALVESGQIRKISDGKGSDRYDGFVEEHYHMRCSKCGKLIDAYPVDQALLEKSKKELASALGMADSELELTDTVFEGLCDDCRNS